MCSFSPGLQTLQSLVDVSLVELCHVGVHFRIVVPNVSLGAPVWDGAKPKRRREVVRALELHGEGGARTEEARKNVCFTKLRVQMRKRGRGGTASDRRLSSYLLV